MAKLARKLKRQSQLMAREERQTLLWVLDDDLTHCPQCKRPLSDVRANLHAFMDTFKFGGSFEFQRCPGGTWIADLNVLETTIEEISERQDENYSSADVIAFEVNGTPADASVWMGGTFGEIPWGEYQDSLEHSLMSKNLPLPTLAEVTALPITLETWQLALSPISFIAEGTDPTRVAQVALVVSKSGLVQGTQIFDHAPEQEELRDLILRSCVHPVMGARPTRPATLASDDPFTVTKLEAALAGLGIRAVFAPVPLALEAVQSLRDFLPAENVPSIFGSSSEHDVRAYHAASQRFFKAQPWELFEADKPIAFRYNDGPWHYATVMGKASEEYGLSFFEDWLQICRYQNNHPSMLEMIAMQFGDEEFSPPGLEAAGAMEGLTLSDLSAFDPEDAQVLHSLKLEPAYHGQYATIHRYNSETGLEAPVLELNAYTLLASVIAERAAIARGDRITSMKAKLETEQGKIEVRFPSRGDEDSTPGSYFRLEFTRKANEFRSPKSLKAIQVSVWAEGSAKIHRVITKVQQALVADGERVTSYINGIQQGEYKLFENRGSKREPSPTLEQLASLENLIVHNWNEYEKPERITISPEAHPGGNPEIRVELTDIKKGSKK
jgi:hypothetical protein